MYTQFVVSGARARGLTLPYSFQVVVGGTLLTALRGGSVFEYSAQLMSCRSGVCDGPASQ